MDLYPYAKITIPGHEWPERLTHNNNSTSCTNTSLANASSFFSKEYIEGFPIELLPLEILYLIIERVDVHTFVSCLHVSRKWKAIALRIANADKKNIRWRSIYELYHEDESFRVKSNKLLSYKELFANSLRWNLNFSFSLSSTCAGNYVKKINIYRDNIIVVDCEGVKYYDVKTHKVKRQFEVAGCEDFNERDAVILRATQAPGERLIIILYGKQSPDDHKFVWWDEELMHYDDVRRFYPNSVVFSNILHYVLENNSCYVLTYYNGLACYTWKVVETELIWDIRALGRYYGSRADIPCAMSVLNSEVFVLMGWGKLIHYCYEQRNFKELTCFRMSRETIMLVIMVNKYCIVIGVPDGCEFRITRYRDSLSYNFCKFECPNLTCATQHGEMLFLGFSDGKLELFKPRALPREELFKHRIHISELTPGPIDPEDLAVVSIDVYEDFEEHHLFIATRSCVYHLVITHPDGICVWDNIPERRIL